ncbi:MAG: hypothetical protein ACE5KM_04435 [Planctomycetaceae bacterium]
MRSMIFCGLTVAVAVTSSPAVAQSPAKAATARLRKQVVPKLVQILGQLGKGQTEAAIDQMEALAGRKFKKTGGPFGSNEREKWQRLFGPFAKHKSSFESVELIGIQHVSSQAHKISLVAHGDAGPILFQFRLYSYRGKIKLGNVRFDSNWDRIEFLVATIKDRIDQRYPLAVQSAAKVRKGAKQ